jgi:plasmid stabilization system protein ParE
VVEARSPKAAGAFVDELDAALERIAESPLRHRTYVAGTRRYLMLRFPFFVVYRIDVDADLIQIVAIAHAKRRPGYWRSR